MNNTQTYRPNGITHNYQYDAAGNQTLDWFNSESPTHYQYDDAGQLQHILYPDGTHTDYAYYANGLTQQMTDTNGVSAYLYDDANQLTQIGRQPNGSINAATAISYAYYPNGWRETMTVGVFPAAPSAAYAYTYFNNGQLQNAAAHGFRFPGKFRQSVSGL